MSSDYSVDPETRAGDPFVAAASQDECHCYLGFHYIGQMCWNEETGEEVEVQFPVACKRCSHE